MNTFFILSAVIGLLIIAISVLVYFIFKIKKRVDIFFENSEIKNLEEILTEQLKKIKKQDKEIKQIFGELEKLNIVAQKSFQKIEVIRFNPFKDTGGDQSFSIVLLDAENNGFVMSSLYTRGDTRIFAKPIKQGVCEYSVSEEEKKIIEKAVKD